MVLDRNEIKAQVEWALMTYEPFRHVQLEKLTCKWVESGYEIRFDGGVAMLANFEGREVATAWLRMGDVERYMFAKDCENLLGKNVTELGHLDHGLLCSLFHLLKVEDAERKIFFGDGVQYEDAVNLLGDNIGIYVDLSHLSPNTWAMVGNHREAELRQKAFQDSLQFKVTSHFK